ncbi:MAG TPA: hypothetical protein VFR40_13045 [Lapillicoccus sp.]|nr:hypothetical protein [Lapillicoccus sp.]
MDAWVWIVLVVIVVAIVAVVLASRSRQRETRREEAADLRDPSAEHHMELREKEAAAAATEAEARRTRAEADQRAAEAQRLEVQAQRASLDRDAAAAESQEKLRRADALDPDVRTDKEGYRVDEQGNRLDTAGAVAGRDLDRADGHANEHANNRDDDTVAGAPTGGRIGNMRGLDNDTRAGETTTGAPATPATPATPAAAPTLDEDGPDRPNEEPGRTPEKPLRSERPIGNFRGLDDDGPSSTTDETAADSEREGTRPGDVDGDGDVDERDKARERADDVLSRRDADRRQPE